MAQIASTARGIGSAKTRGGISRPVLVILALAICVVSAWLILRPAPAVLLGRVSKGDPTIPSGVADPAASTLVMEILSPTGVAKSGRPAVVANPGPPTIIVDPGHGGNDNGARRNGLHEKDLTLDTALRLELRLRQLGFPVVLTRREDRYVELSERSDIANRYPRALFVSIHFNDFASSVGQGVETFYASDKVPDSDVAWYFANLFPTASTVPPLDNGMAFAKVVQASAVKVLGVADRGVKAAGYAVVRHSRCPAVLVEGGFINNRAQAREIGTPEYREKLAYAIAEAVAIYHRQRTEEERLRLSQAGQ